MQLILIILFLSACGTAPQGEESSSPTDTKKDVLPSNSNDPNKVEKASSTPSVPGQKDAPFGWSLSIFENKTNKSSIKLTLSKHDKVRAVRVAENNCGPNYKEYPYGSSVEVEFASRNTMVTIAGVLVGMDGSISDCRKATFEHDNRPPTGGKIEINDGDVYTTFLGVDLTITSDNAKFMYVTNTPGCVDGGYWSSLPLTTKNWDLAEKNTTNKVYVKFKDEFDNESPCISDSIIHDDIPPRAASITIANGAASTTVRNVDISVFALDAVKMDIGGVGTCSSPVWRDYSPYGGTYSLTTRGSSTVVYAAFKDEAGNTTCVLDSIETPDITVTYKWYEGFYYPIYTQCGYTKARDYTTFKTRTEYRAPFSSVTQSSVGNCQLSGSGTSYVCDWSNNLANCSQAYSVSYACNGYMTTKTYPGALQCVKPSVVP